MNSMAAWSTTGADPLRHHGDAELAEGLLDFAVNVRGERPPHWLHEKLVAALAEIGHYPTAAADVAARAAIAHRHARRENEILPLHGAAEAFTLLPRLRPNLAAVVHPSFTEPEAALRAADVPVVHAIADEATGFALPTIPEEADLVVLGNPTNPTSVLHSSADILALTRPGRLVVVDEAFADAVPGEPQSLASQRIPGVLVIRSLTKTWALAGLRAGYLIGEPSLVQRLDQHRPQWPVSTLALHALRWCNGKRALTEAATDAELIVEQRSAMARKLRQFENLTVYEASGPFLLVHAPRGTREALRHKGIAVRRCDTFPGLDEHYLRLAVRGGDDVHHLIKAMEDVLR